LVGEKKEVKLNNGLFSVHVDKQLKDTKKTDLVIKPALFGDMQSAISKNKTLLPWINEQNTGLLDGKKCSTHWGFQNEFRQLFPQVEVIDGGVITEEHHIYSSGGANSYWSLLLHLLEKYANREIAILASKYFAVDIDRDSQAAFAMFKKQKNHTDQNVKKAQEYIEKI
jgi:hypothetical protein